VCFADSPISWTSTRHDSCRPPSTARDGYTAGASYRNEWSESDHHQECRGRVGRKGSARHRGRTLSTWTRCPSHPSCQS
jgi:hypothetical protein